MSGSHISGGYPPSIRWTSMNSAISHLLCVGISCRDARSGWEQPA